MDGPRKGGGRGEKWGRGRESYVIPELCIVSLNLGLAHGGKTQGALVLRPRAKWGVQDVEPVILSSNLSIGVWDLRSCEAAQAI